MPSSLTFNSNCILQGPDSRKLCEFCILLMQTVHKFYYTFQNYRESFQKVQELCRLSGNFPNCSETIQTRVWRIFGYSNIFEYFLVRIFIRIMFVSFFWCKYIQIFIRFLIRRYWDIRSYHFFDTNIFGYSFVLFFIWIY